jgi:hypothetical protein
MQEKVSNGHNKGKERYIVAQWEAEEVMFKREYLEHI